MKSIAVYAAVVLLTLSFLVLLWQFREAMVVFTLSVAISAAFRPLIDWLVGRGLPRPAALLLAYFSVIAVFVALAVALSGPLVRDIQLAADDFAAGYARLKGEWSNGTLFQQTVAEQLPAPENLFAAMAGERGLSIAQTILGAAANLAQLVSSLAIILILSMYWSADNVRFERLWLSLLPVELRARARDVWRSIEAGVGAYIQDEMIQSLLAGALLWLGYWSMGLRYPALLALAGALAWLVPWLGAVAAVIPPLLVGLLVSGKVGALAALYTLMVLLVMELAVEPRFFPRPRYSSLLLVLVVIAFGMTFGLVGVILAPPFAAAVQIFFSQYAQLRGLAGPPPAAPRLSEDALRQLADLNRRLAEVREALSQAGAAPAPEVSSLVQRLDQLVERANAFLEDPSNGRPSPEEAS